MKKRKLCVFLICVSVLLSSAVSAQESTDADGYRISVSDGTQLLLSGQPGSAIREIHVKSVSSDDWGTNYLEQEGQSLSPDPGGRVDLLIVGEDGVGYAFLDLPLTGSASFELVPEGTTVRLSVSGDGQSTQEIRDAVIWSDIPVKMTAQDSLRVRTSPSTDQNNAVAMLKPGDTIDVYGETSKIGDHAWAVFRMDGEWRYVAADFLTDAGESTDDPASGQDDASAGDESRQDEPAADAAVGDADTSENGSEDQDDTGFPDGSDSPEMNDQISAPVSDGFIGPIQQLPVRKTEEIRSFLDPGSVYLFTTYEDGSVSVEIHSDGEK